MASSGACGSSNMFRSESWLKDSVFPCGQPTPCARGAAETVVETPMIAVFAHLSNATAVPLTLVLQRHCVDAIPSAMCFPKESHFI